MEGDILEDKLRYLMRTKGSEYTIEVASKILNVKDVSSKKPIVNGNVCEALLKVLTEHYLAIREIEGFCARSVVLKDPTKLDSNFRTEIDFILITPYLVFITECKSYSGVKTITNECTLTNERYTCDIYKQNKIHVEVFFKNTSVAHKSTGKMDIAMSAFMFSNGVIYDNRTSAFRQYLPIITVDKLYKFYDSFLTGTKNVVWDMKQLNKLMKVVHSNDSFLHDEHRKYLGY